MEDKKQKTKYEELGIPKNIIIQNNTYSFKKELLNDNVSYRCIHRKCKAGLKISIANAKKIEDNEGALNTIDFSINGEHTNHPNEKNIVLEGEKVKTEKKLIEMAKILIKQNIQNPLSFHIQNLESNNIKISKIKIKNILQNFREDNFPKDDIFLDHIESIRIDLGDSEETKNIYFCPGKENFINYKTNKIEKNVYFTSIFKIKLLSEAEEIFIDATFKMAPKNYYQILNIWGYIKNKKIYLPLIHVLMTSKHQTAYNHVFKFIKQLLLDNNIEINFSEKILYI